MMTEMVELSDADIETVQRFVSALNDIGLRAHLAFTIIENYEATGDSALKLVNELLRDIFNCKRLDCADGAPSLVMLTEAAKNCTTIDFPDDYLIPQEVLDKCLSYFWQSRR